MAWRKYFWSGPIWRAWVCPGCGALLKWRLLRRIAYVAIMIVGIQLYFRMGRLPTFAGDYTAMLILIPALAALMLATERVRVSGHIGLVCLGCGYSLAELRLDSGGDLRCPECGRVAEQKQLVHCPPTVTESV